jgi:hypothetical protein
VYLIKPIFGDDTGESYYYTDWLDERNDEGSVSGEFRCHLINTTTFGQALGPNLPYIQ